MDNVVEKDIKDEDINPIIPEEYLGSYVKEERLIKVTAERDKMREAINKVLYDFEIARGKVLHF